MAHADYNCCARCDRKMDYSSDPTTKEEVCGDCAVTLFQVTGVRLTTGTALTEYIKAHNEVEVAKLGITPCYYTNDVDSAVAEKLGPSHLNKWAMREALEKTRLDPGTTFDPATPKEP